MIDKQVFSIQHFISTTKRSLGEGSPSTSSNGFVLCEPCLIVKPTRILLLITALHTHIVLVLQAAAKVLECLIKLYFKTQGTMKFIIPSSLVTISSASIYDSSNIHLITINAATFYVYLLQAAAKEPHCLKASDFKTQGSTEFITFRSLVVP